MFHLSNLPGIQSVSCTDDSVSASLDSLHHVLSWAQTPILLVVDHTFDCHDGQVAFLHASSWDVNESSKEIVFKTQPARESGIDGKIKIQLASVNLDKIIDINDFGGDLLDFGDLDEPSSGQPEEPPLNRTLVYPYKFNFNLNRRFSIGTTNAYVDCQPCTVKGEIDLVIVIVGSLRSDYFGMASYITGDIKGTFDLAAGLQGNTFNDKITLFQREFAPFELPGVIYIDPFMSLYAHASLTTDAELSFKSALSAEAQNFNVKIVSIGDQIPITSVRDVDALTFEPTKATDMTMAPPTTGAVDVETRLSLLPELEVKYKMMGYPKQQVNFMNQESYYIV